jgi:hypothetical protein
MIDVGVWKKCTRNIRDMQKEMRKKLYARQRRKRRMELSYRIRRMEALREAGLMKEWFNRVRVESRHCN